MLECLYGWRRWRRQREVRKPSLERRNTYLKMRSTSLDLSTGLNFARTHSDSEEERALKIYGFGNYCQHNRVLLCMVGLPARGKSYIVRMLERYLRWTGFQVQSFNAGNLRRQEGMGGADASFFTSDDKTAIREKIAGECMEEAFHWLLSQSSASIAIFDATNTTKKRRATIHRRSREVRGITPVFIESICDDPKILSQNYTMKLENDDYRGKDPETARADFLARVDAYSKRYETIDDDEFDQSIIYVKIFNVGRKVVMCRCSGYIMSHIGFYLSNIHINPRRIWLIRHAETEDGRNGRVGSGSNKITASGKKFINDLAEYLYKARTNMSEAGDIEGSNMMVLMGTAPVHKSTCDFLMGKRGNRGSRSVALQTAIRSLQDCTVMSTSLLNELDGGDCNGMSYEEIKANYPEIYDERERDKLNFRYPGSGGESYCDVIGRLKPVIIELERQRQSVLVISHLAVQRCIYGYFTGEAMEMIPHIELPLHSAIELRPMPHGTKVAVTELL
mmetsp:Transcript_40531/g.88592  ORF Transcript_40531/g.88592 Transcript_40531/m.88592 type:complete len:506 (+) Transcript_40531:87-1604(+)